MVAPKGTSQRPTHVSQVTCDLLPKTSQLPLPTHESILAIPQQQEALTFDQKSDEKVVFFGVPQNSCVT